MTYVVEFFKLLLSKRELAICSSMSGHSYNHHVGFVLSTGLRQSSLDTVFTVDIPKLKSELIMYPLKRKCLRKCRYLYMKPAGTNPSGQICVCFSVQNYYLFNDQLSIAH